jgi:hypothetical protein
VIDAHLRGRRLADQSVDRRVDGTDQHPLSDLLLPSASPSSYRAFPALHMGVLRVGIASLA